MALVIDVSVVARWFLPDERSTFADTILDRVVESGAYVPALFRWEIENVLISAERASRIAASDVDEALQTLRDLPIFVDSCGERIFSGSEVQLARHYDLTSYDAAYLALAIDRRLSLATTDTGLYDAARDLDVPVLFE